MHITVYGHDLPALVTAASLAENGNQVQVLPLDAPAGWTLEDTTSKEPGLAQLFHAQQQTGRLTWQHSRQVDGAAHIHLLSLTPQHAQATQALVEQLAPQLSAESLLVIQTLHGVGVAEGYQQRLRDLNSQAQVVVWPEFMAEGAAIAEFTRPSRIILGSCSDQAVAVMRDLLRPYNRVRDTLLVMSPAAAELTKYAINTLLALRVSAMNEFANLAESIGVDIEQVRQGIGTDPRIGFNYLYPGAGFGGPNFMSDLQAMLATFEAHQQRPKLLPAALAVNARQQEVLFSKLWQTFAGQLSGKTFALWGVSYKPGTATIDQAPSLRLIDALLAQGASLRVHDPKALPNLLEHYKHHPNIQACPDPYHACQGSHALLVMTEWKAYWNPDWQQVKSGLLTPHVFDGRNIYDRAALQGNGFIYCGVGR